MATYEQVHAGSIVLGHDGELWGVESIDKTTPQLAVTLVKHGQRVTGYPPAGTEVTVVEEPDVRAEGWAWNVLAEAGLDPVVIRESV